MTLDEYGRYIVQWKIRETMTELELSQSNGRIERWHQSLKRECIRPECPLSIEDARRIVANFVKYYNIQKFHSIIGYITPKDEFEGEGKADIC